MARTYGRIVTVVLVLTAGLLGREPAQAQRSTSNSFIVTHVRVFDGARTLQDTQVAVSEGIIRAIGNDLVAWRHLPAIDGTGATLLPGLIDAHAHVRSADDLRLIAPAGSWIESNSMQI